MSNKGTDKTGQRGSSPTSGTRGGSPGSNPSFEEVFQKYSKEGNNQSDEINQQNVERWFEQARIKDVSKSDAGKTFAKVAKGKKGIKKEQFREFLNELAREKKTDASQLENQLRSAGGPHSPGGKRQSPGSPGSPRTNPRDQSPTPGGPNERLNTGALDKGSAGGAQGSQGGRGPTSGAQGGQGGKGPVSGGQGGKGPTSGAQGGQGGKGPTSGAQGGQGGKGPTSGAQGGQGVKGPASGAQGGQGGKRPTSGAQGGQQGAQ